ncbi:putative repeat protein (TIGR01451 family) [Comamonas sp. BIGb0152]|uniref:DUF11 domain-containing protein n=1 Tax=Comamonas sp. BIGb0152 TaxID=2940601 RepID=UPI00216865C4|nr:DUF11 domain-containing protein [Comamonas sp. BIGb0152]MCS4296216.1 putative repeat protein (TIGR01451 family) [Comamonas sp. BIGb0152]
MNAIHRQAAFIAVSLVGMAAASSVQAASLTCGVPLRVSTASASNWSTDARYVSAPTGAAATIREDYQWNGWFNPATETHGASSGSLNGQPFAGKWLSFGDASFVEGNANGGNTGTGTYPAVITNGDTANGAWVNGRATFIYNDTINIASNVNLATIRVRGVGGFDDNTQFVVRPSTPPSGASDWLQTQNLGTSYASPGTINLDSSASGLGFYYGDNTIGFAVQNAFSAPTTSQGNPTGLMADIEITADCQNEPPAQPAVALSCPAGSLAGDEVRVGPFTTNARDWKWAQRMNAAGTALENVEQPLFDSYRYRSYFDPATLATATDARWISPGTTNPASTDIPGVPYPAATGQSRGIQDGSTFVMNQPVNVGSNVDLASIKLTGRFAFDDYGSSVYVKPAAGAETPAGPVYLPNGYGAFSTYTTTTALGFARGNNTVGFRLDGGQETNDCAGGTCALGAIADFYVTAACTGEPPNADLSITNASAATSVAPGATVTYTITASNAGPVEATGATVTNTLPAALTDATWTCVGAGGGTCSASGSGNINDTVNLPVGASVTYTVTAKVAANATGSLASTASIAAPAGIDDPTPANNSATANSAIATPGSATPVPALDLAGLALLGALSAGIGTFALRRRQRGQ